MSLCDWRSPSLVCIFVIYTCRLMRMIFYHCLFYLLLVFNSACANFLEAKITSNSNIEWVFNDCGCNKPPHIRNAVLAVKPMDDDKRCQNCITCKELESPMALFFERYGQITNLESTMVQDPVKWQQLISNWLNQKLGFNLTYKVYETFASNCLGDSLINDSSWVYLWSEMGYSHI